MEEKISRDKKKKREQRQKRRGKPEDWMGKRKRKDKIKRHKMG